MHLTRSNLQDRLPKFDPGNAVVVHEFARVFRIDGALVGAGSHITSSGMFCGWAKCHRPHHINWSLPWITRAKDEKLMPVLPWQVQYFNVQ
jgi:hypothetical protein